MGCSDAEENGMVGRLRGFRAFISYDASSSDVVK